MRQLDQSYLLELRWRAFPLRPDTPEEGLDMAQVLAAKGLDIVQVEERMAKVAAELGLPLGRRTRTYNSTRAQELGYWAEQQGKGWGFHLAMFKASFVDCLPISSPQVLAQVAESAGLDPQEALRHLEQGTFQAQVRADWDLARQWQITAAPTFLAGERRVVGAQPYPILARLVEEAGAQPRPAALSPGPSKMS